MNSTGMITAQLCTQEKWLPSKKSLYPKLQTDKSMSLNSISSCDLQGLDKQSTQVLKNLSFLLFQLKAFQMTCGSQGHLSLSPKGKK